MFVLDVGYTYFRVRIWSKKQKIIAQCSTLQVKVNIYTVHDALFISQGPWSVHSLQQKMSGVEKRRTLQTYSRYNPMLEEHRQI